MDPSFLLVENFGRLAAMFGLLVAAPMIAYGGYLYVTAMGDPNRSGSVRNAVISVGIGVIVIGSSFILPRVVADFVIAPSGGVTYEGGHHQVDCDQILREQLVVNREASIPSRMAFVIQFVQAHFDGCDAEFWDPAIRDHTHGFTACYDDPTALTLSVSGVALPGGLDRGSYSPSRRDAQNNIMVHFQAQFPPSNGALCWMYLSSLDAWVEGY